MSIEGDASNHRAPVLNPAVPIHRGFIGEERNMYSQ